MDAGPVSFFSAHVMFSLRNRFAKERVACLGFLLIISERNCSEKK
jgi:hypothetical protein